MGVADKARAKITAEMEKTKHGDPKEQLCKMILAWLEFDAEAAEKVMQKNKTVDGCMKHIKFYARGKAVGGVAAVAPDESAMQMLIYYGLEEDTARMQCEEGLVHHIFMSLAKEWQRFAPHASAVDAAQTAPLEKTGHVSVSLEDLL